MTEREMHRLSRKELLEMLLEQRREAWYSALFSGRKTFFLLNIRRYTVQSFRYGRKY